MARRLTLVQWVRIPPILIACSQFTLETEDLIAESHLIHAAIMFGRGKAQVGVAIEPISEVRITNDTERQDFINKIWCNIENANALAPAHSRIFKEMILIVDPNKTPFPRTPKGTIMRNALYKE